MKFLVQLIEVQARHISQLDLLQVPPQPLHRVEIRGVRRQRLDMDLPLASAMNALTSARRWIGDPSQTTSKRSPARWPRWTRNAIVCSPFKACGRTSV